MEKKLPTYYGNCSQESQPHPYYVNCSQESQPHVKLIKVFLNFGYESGCSTSITEVYPNSLNDVDNKEWWDGNSIDNTTKSEQCTNSKNEAIEKIKEIINYYLPKSKIEICWKENEYRKYLEFCISSSTEDYDFLAKKIVKIYSGVSAKIKNNPFEYRINII